MSNTTLDTATDRCAAAVHRVSGGLDTLSAHAARLSRDPFAIAVGDDVENAWVDCLNAEDVPQRLAMGARIFESARRSTGLAPPARHALLKRLDQGLARACPDYRTAPQPLARLAALDTWYANVHTQVLEAAMRAESGACAVPFSQEEVRSAELQQAILACVMPEQAAKLARLCEASDPWQTRFAGHLRRAMLMTLQATMHSDTMVRLYAFLQTPGGRACLAARAVQGAPPCIDVASAPGDPPELTDLQGLLAQMMSEAAGASPAERQAYYAEMAERMLQGL